MYATYETFEEAREAAQALWTKGRKASVDLVRSLHCYGMETPRTTNPYALLVNGENE